MNVAHTRQSRLDTGLGFPLTVLKSIEVVPASLGSGLIVLAVRGVWLKVERDFLPVARGNASKLTRLHRELRLSTCEESSLLRLSGVETFRDRSRLAEYSPVDMLGACHKFVDFNECVCC